MNGHRSWRFRRRGAVVAASAAVAALVAACSSSPSSTAPTTPAPKTIVGTYGVAKGNLPSLTWDLPYGERNTIDPPNTAFYNSALIAANLCDPLLRLK
jgi:peptide/nickel transport system substrate-binding protein